MENEIEKLSIARVNDQVRTQVEDVVVREFSLTIMLNNQEVMISLCSPANLDCLAAGFLLSQGLIEIKDDIEKIAVDERRGIAQVETGKEVDIPSGAYLASGGGRSAGYFNADKISTEHKIRLSVLQVFSLMDKFVQRSGVFKATGGVHSAALCDTENILVFNEDIGRHNAIDKVFGECLLKDISTDNRLIMTSGRVSSEILLKVAKRDISILISKSAPTDLGVKLANDLGVTLVGFARGRRMNIYTNDWRIVTDGQ